MKFGKNTSLYSCSLIDQSLILFAQLYIYLFIYISPNFKYQLYASSSLNNPTLLKQYKSIKSIKMIIYIPDKFSRFISRGRKSGRGNESVLLQSHLGEHNEGLPSSCSSCPWLWDSSTLEFPRPLFLPRLMNKGEFIRCVLNFLSRI
jgi:hypothetical protein